jgi:hypothetical protein
VRKRKTGKKSQKRAAKQQLHREPTIRMPNEYTSHLASYFALIFPLPERDLLPEDDEPSIGVERLSTSEPGGESNISS